MPIKDQKETYSAVVTANALQTTRNGTDSVAIQFQATNNLSVGEECDKKFIANLWITPNAIENTIKTLREAFDYKQNTFLPLNDPATLLGKECEITVQYEEYNGELRPKVQWINKAGSFNSLRIKPVNDSIAKSIAARFDAYFTQGGTRQSTGNSYAPANKNSPQTYAPADDLPF